MDHLIVISTDCPVSPNIDLAAATLRKEDIPQEDLQKQNNQKENTPKEEVTPKEEATQKENALKEDIEDPDVNEKKYLHALGLSWYPPDDSSAMIIKELQETPGSKFGLILKDWEQFYSNLFFCYVRRSNKKIVRQYVQPFTRSYASHDWVCSILGTLPMGIRDLLPLGEHPIFEPIGKSAAEYLFCWIMNNIREQGFRAVAEIPEQILHDLFKSINKIVPCSIMLSDGKDIIAFRGGEGSRSLYYKRIIPPIQKDNYQFFNLNIDISDDLNRTYMIFSSIQPKGYEWNAMLPEQMIIARQGIVQWDSDETRDEKLEKLWVENVEEKTPDLVMVSPQLSIPDSDMIITGLDENLLHVHHETVYRYEVPVEFSRHYIRLFPIHDRNQQVISHQITISTDPIVELFEDVFDNVTGFFQMKQSFNELKIVMESEILVRSPSESMLGSPSLSQTFPITWMPWQRQTMMPYLLPIELPESQLSELNTYARSFVQRNDNDVLNVLMDINQTIYRDFTYDTGTTTIHTTPYDVYVNRHGVCQDFANLFICLVRLLGIPARYRVGYIYTGHDYERRIQSDASHAWVEVYLPWIGWKGYDPTNGCIVGTNHVRVSCGRNYYDPPPTSGTIYKGGYGEQLEVGVKVYKITQT